ncbi:MAG: transporter ATP-binding protein [Hyphomicrobiales bacterium]|nr:transporter ATP-binding protein [Hyphomicrobiales bacterium]
MTELIVEKLVKRYGAVAAVNDVSFTVGDGELVTLLGPSGCGKSTTLAAIAGLDVPTSGSIRVDKSVFFDSTSGISLPAESRNCGLVFQSYALWPHLSVEQNVAFPLKLRRVPKAEQRRRVGEVLELVEMNALAGRFPHELSGGQQQRVALARAIVYRPAVLLLDEPLSNLDAKLRERARVWLGEIHHQIRQTTLYVTHDQLEALALSDRIAVMNGGKIAQLATPREIYEAPADLFVADFIGTSSFFKGVLTKATQLGEVAEVRLSGGELLRVLTHKSIAADQNVVIAVRPENIQILTSPAHRPDQDGTVLAARITGRSYLGAHYQYELMVEGVAVKVEASDDYAGNDLKVWIPASGCVVFPARVVQSSA